MFIEITPTLKYQTKEEYTKDLKRVFRVILDKLDKVQIDEPLYFDIAENNIVLKVVLDGIDLHELKDKLIQNEFYELITEYKELLKNVI